jgi:hypothetical protein
MTTEISVQRAGGLALATFADAMKFGETVANSEFAPKDFRGKPASCMLAIQAGAEIGLAPLQALQSIAVVNGRPAVFGDAALAVAKASAVCEYVTESVDGDGEQMVATCTAKRRGYPQPTVVKFTVADAKKAGLWGKAGPWTQYPKRMLQMRARGFALRDAFPDVLKGLVTAEEAQDYPTPAEQPRADAGSGITVHHVKSFVPPQETPVGKAKLAIGKCQDLAAAERLRELITQRETAGVFTRDESAELLQLLHGRVEMLIGSEDTSAVEVTA